jgi:hypothetical protein
MYLQKVKCKKNRKNIFDVMKVTDENSRIRSRIHVKISWIRTIYWVAVAFIVGFLYTRYQMFNWVRQSDIIY